VRVCSARVVCRTVASRRHQKTWPSAAAAAKRAERCEAILRPRTNNIRSTDDDLCLVFERRVFSLLRARDTSFGLRRYRLEHSRGLSNSFLGQILSFSKVLQYPPQPKRIDDKSPILIHETS